MFDCIIMISVSTYNKSCRWYPVDMNSDNGHVASTIPLIGTHISLKPVCKIFKIFSTVKVHHVS